MPLVTRLLLYAALSLASSGVLAASAQASDLYVNPALAACSDAA